MFIFLAGTGLFIASLAIGPALRRGARDRRQPMHGRWRILLPAAVAAYVLFVVAAAVTGEPRTSGERFAYVFFALLVASLGNVYMWLHRGTRLTVQTQLSGSVPHKRLQGWAARQRGLMTGGLAGRGRSGCCSMATWWALMDGSLTMIGLGTAAHGGRSD